MRQAVFLSSGIGNALLMIPLVKALKERGTVSAICTSVFEPEEVFKGFTEPLFDDFIRVRNYKGFLHRAVFGKRIFDHVYLDHFSTSRKQSILALRLGEEVYAAHREDSMPVQLNSERVTLVEPHEGIHEAAQCMRLLDPDFCPDSLRESHFRMHASTAAVGDSGMPYITLQFGAGNGRTPWKTLPAATWHAVISQLLPMYPDHLFFILGDSVDAEAARALPRHERVVVATARYKLNELAPLMAGASLHLGGDSALMHLAGCLGVPTLTVWGGSDPAMYGWQRIAPHKHALIHAKLPCGPCSRWLNPNTRRVSDPAACPDFACIRGITAPRIAEAAIELLGR